MNLVQIIFGDHWTMNSGKGRLDRTMNSGEERLVYKGDWVCTIKNNVGNAYDTMVL